MDKSYKKGCVSHSRSHYGASVDVHKQYVTACVAMLRGAVMWKLAVQEFRQSPKELPSSSSIPFGDTTVVNDPVGRWLFQMAWDRKVSVGDHSLDDLHITRKQENLLFNASAMLRFHEEVCSIGKVNGHRHPRLDSSELTIRDVKREETKRKDN